MNFNKLFLSFIAILIFSCDSSHQIIVLDNPMFATDPVEDAGMDSIGFLMRKHVIVVTVKDKNELHLYNAIFTFECTSLGNIDLVIRSLYIISVHLSYLIQRAPFSLFSLR